MKGDLTIQRRPDGDITMIVELPANVIDYIANGGDMTGKRAAIVMDSELALVLAHELREAATQR